MIVPILLLFLFTAVAAYQLHFMDRRRKPARAWQEILLKFEPVNMEGLQLIADDYLHPSSNQLQIEPPVMMEMVGGDEGLKRLLRNAGLMLELAVLAEQWNRVEGIIVAEMLRRDAVRIRRAARQIRWDTLWSNASVRGAFQLQEAISSYCLMRARLLGLYANAHIALVPHLEAAM